MQFWNCCWKETAIKHTLVSCYILISFVSIGRLGPISQEKSREKFSEVEEFKNFHILIFLIIFNENSSIKSQYKILSSNNLIIFTKKINFLLFTKFLVVKYGPDFAETHKMNWNHLIKEVLTWTIEHLIKIGTLTHANIQARAHFIRLINLITQKNNEQCLQSITRPTPTTAATSVCAVCTLLIGLYLFPFHFSFFLNWMCELTCACACICAVFCLPFSKHKLNSCAYSIVSNRYKWTVNHRFTRIEYAPFIAHLKFSLNFL